MGRKSTKFYVLMGVFAFALVGCSSSKFAGNYNGLLKPSGKAPAKKAGGYSESKPIYTSTLSLEGNGSFTAKFREVSYTGDWKESGKSIVLTPKTYMGMSQENFPATKKDAGAGAVDSLFKPREFEIGADGKTLVHTDDEGVDTFTKAD